MKELCRRIPVLIPVLILAAVILSACVNMLEAPRAKEGAGTVSIVIDGHSAGARTLGPDTKQFTRYTASLSGGTGTPEEMVLAGGSGTASLAPGAWTITVTAWTGAAEPYAAAGRGSATVTVEPGKTADAYIAIAPIVEAGKQGTLRYSVAVPPGAGGTLSLAGMSDDSAVAGSPFTLTGGTATDGSLTLAAGAYLMAIRLEQSVTGPYGGRTEAVHIYHGLETAAEYVFTESIFLKEAIAISAQPQSVTVTEATISGALSVRAAANNGSPVSYQWYQDNSSETPLDGKTDSSFDIPADLTAGTYRYFCKLSAEGCETVNSVTVTVTVKGAGSQAASIAVYAGSGGAGGAGEGGSAAAYGGRATDIGGAGSMGGIHASGSGNSGGGGGGSLINGTDDWHRNAADANGVMPGLGGTGIGSGSADGADGSVVVIGSVGGAGGKGADATHTSTDTSADGIRVLGGHGGQGGVGGGNNTGDNGGNGGNGGAAQLTLNADISVNGNVFVVSGDGNESPAPGSTSYGTSGTGGAGGDATLTTTNKVTATGMVYVGSGAGGVGFSAAGNAGFFANALSAQQIRLGKNAGGNIAFSVNTLDVTSGNTDIFLYNTAASGSSVSAGNNGVYIGTARLGDGNLSVGESLPNLSNSAAAIGVLQLEGRGVFSDTTENHVTLGSLTVDGGTLHNGNWSGLIEHAYTTNPGITLGSNGATVELNAGQDKVLTRALTGTGYLTKTGDGTLTLSGTNSYTGMTTVQSGTLALSGGGSISGGLALHDGAVFDPGGAAVSLDQLTVRGSAVYKGVPGLGSSSTVAFDLPSGVSAGDVMLAVTGAVDLTGVTVTVSGPFSTLAAGAEVTLIDKASGTPANSNAIIAGGGRDFKIAVSKGRLIATAK